MLQQKHVPRPEAENYRRNLAGFNVQLSLGYKRDIINNLQTPIKLTDWTKNETFIVKNW